ncbi:MAG: MFS transporter, partial [Candidatus Geothermarchaeales archaeon]
MGFVSFFTDVSTEMILGILPIFIVSELGATKAILGLIEGGAEALSHAFRAFSGIISDRIGRRKALVFIGYALSTVSKPFFAVARVWTDALFIRVGDRVGKGVRTSPRDALLSESVGAKQTGMAFGIHRSLDQAGAIVGPVLAFTLIPLMGFRDIFWLSFMPGAVAVAILLVFVRERAVRPKSVGVFKNVGDVLRGRFILLLVIIGVFSIGAFNFSFILIRAEDLGVAAGFIPLVYVVINIAHTAVGIPAGTLADRIGKERVLMLGYASFFLAALLGMSLTGNPLYAYLIAAVYGVYIGIAETVQRALIPDYSRSESRGTAYGLYYLTVGACFFIANSLFGAL